MSEPKDEDEIIFLSRKETQETWFEKIFYKKYLKNFLKTTLYKREKFIYFKKIFIS